MKQPGLDQRMQELLQKNQLGIPLTTCSSGNKTTYICINPNCTEPSLHCEDCKDCQYHLVNSCQSIRVKVFTFMINTLSQSKKSLLKAIIEQESKLMEKLQATKQKILETLGLSCLDQQEINLVTNIYKSKEKVNMTGKDAAVIFLKLQKDKKVKEKYYANLINTFRQDMQKFAQQIIHLERKLFNSNLTQETIKIDSLIIGQNQEGCRFIQRCLADISRPVNVRLLIRASRHNFSLKQLHKRCNGNNNILMIVKTELNKVIGGYAHCRWPQAFQSSYDFSGHSFLFSVSLKQKMSLISPRAKFYFQNSTAICFAGSIDSQKGKETQIYPDLSIADQCNLNMDSYALFPISYNCNGKYKNIQKTFELFSGAKYNDKFRVVQYEVFTVTFEK